jgi:hypothetical protein
MLQIPLPITSSEVDTVSRLARERWLSRDSAFTSTRSLNNTRLPRPRSTSPTNETVYADPTRNAVTVLAAAEALDHGCRCNGCSAWIRGKRYQCANCPSDPVAYNLVRRSIAIRTFHSSCSAPLVKSTRIACITLCIPSSSSTVL